MSEERYMTHGLEAEAREPKDCLSRRVLISISKDGDYFIKFETKYQNDTEPLVTPIVLSAQAAELLVASLSELQQNPNKFKLPEPQDDGTGVKL
jgi:hypothetical protein